MQVSVTQKDIITGQRKHLRECPVACALLRAMNTYEPNRYQVAVIGSRIGLFDMKKGEAYEFEAPDSVQAFVTEFDGGLIPPPFSFKFNPTNGRPSQELRRVFCVEAYQPPPYIYMYPIDLKPLKSVKYEKIISLEKDIKEVAEIKTPTIDEVSEFLAKYEEPVLALVKV
jgi:hypothetical protein